MSYQRDTIRLCVRLITNSIREEFIPTNAYTYMRITTKKLSRLHLQRILVLYGVREVAIESNSIVQILPVRRGNQSLVTNPRIFHKDQYQYLYLLQESFRALYQ
jgi:hypothetical protein